MARRAADITAFAALTLALVPCALAQVRAGDPLPALDGVGITERLGAQVPTTATFTSAEGKRVTLGELFARGKPLVLTLNYSSCPMLCSLQLTELTKTLKQMPWTVGDDFEVVTISLDAHETPERARATKERYLSGYGRGEGERGWHFLVGDEPTIRQVADAVGFGFRYDEGRKEFLHQAAVMILAPSGTVSRYLYGLLHSPATLRLSLVEATEGKLASTIDAIVLFCFHYDATIGRYAPMAQNLMRAGGVLTVLAFGAFFGIAWRRERRRGATT